ncbi:MAG TPA: ABC transporter substrate-binding protein [Devosia sp.]|jgi:iron complex transport system substrate-binding protein|nr:ABC transporter substrate-binding protein [Devosia sp.]
MRMKLLSPLAVAALVLVPVAASAASWIYTGRAGETVTLDDVPTRIIASQDAAAGLIPLGIRPIAIYADGPVAEVKPLQGLDLTGIEIIGQAWGEVDIERAAALDPQLIIAEYWPLDSVWSGGEAVVEALGPLAPITGVVQGDSVLTLIEDFEALAASLGTDLARPEIAADKAAFEQSLAAFKAAIAAKPDLTALAVWAGTDALYVAAPAGSAELMDFKSWGLDIIEPEQADDRGYWETLSWENADKYQPDLILVDNRQASTMDTALAQPIWTLMQAAEVGAVADWPAFWLRNYRAYAAELDKLTQAIEAADEHLTR